MSLALTNAPSSISDIYIYNHGSQKTTEHGYYDLFVGELNKKLSWVFLGELGGGGVGDITKKHQPFLIESIRAWMMDGHWPGQARPNLHLFSMGTSF